MESKSRRGAHIDVDSLATFDSNASCRHQRGGALVIQNLCLSHDHRLLFQQPSGTTASLSHGVVTGLVGVNGSGKTSLSRILASKQLPGFPLGLNVTYVTTSIGLEEDDDENHHASDMTPEAYIWSKVEERIGGIQSEIDQLEAKLEAVEDPDQIEQISEQLANLYDVQESVNTEAKSAIMEAISQTDLLIIDEPSFLDARSMEWFVEQMQRAAKNQNAMVLLVSHKEALLDQLCERIWYINAGNQTLTTYNCGYSTFRATHEAEVQHASSQLAETHEKVQDANKALTHIKAQLNKREKNFKGKTTENADKRFIKGKNKESKQNADKSAASKLKQLERKAEEMEELKYKAKRELVRPLRIEGTVSSERLIVQLSEVGLAYDEMGDESIFRNVDSSIEATDRILLTGENGCGKSSLLKLIAGQMEPTEGSIHVHAQQNLLYFPQTALSDLIIKHGKESATAFINDLAANWTETRLRQHLGNFDLKGDLALRSIATLSAGQRVRLWLAKQLVNTPHPALLMLDEISKTLT